MRRPVKAPTASRARGAALVRRKGGILLDISLGGQPQPNSVTFTDLKRSPLKVPWPLPDKVVHTAVVTHVLDFLAPGDVFRWFDELHRVMRPGGVAYFSGPYGGDESVGWLSDPAHRTRVVEATFAWLDPRTPLYAEHDQLARPRPRPWHVLALARVPGTLGTISYNCTLQAQGLAPKGRKKHAR